MKSGNFLHCNSLYKFNKEIVTFLQQHHGEDYTLNHNELNSLINDIGFEQNVTVKELGVNQGASLSTILLNPFVVNLIGIDNKPDSFRPYQKLFSDYAKDNSQNFSFFGVDSLSRKAIDIECDILHIDSLHDFDHLKNELMTHGPKTSSYILIHDTKLYPKQVKAIMAFIKKYSEWQIKKVEERNVGYHVLERKK